MTRKGIIISGIGIFLSIMLFLILFFSIPRVKYRVDKEYDVAYVYGMYGSKNKVTIKDTYKGYDVVYIGDKAFFKKNIKEVVLPNTVKEINRAAFMESKLKSINLDNVEVINNNAFSYTKLEDVTFGGSIIAGSAFYHCSNLRSITFSKLLDIGSMALSETGITSLVIPKTCDTVGVKAFDYMDNLKSIKIYGNKLKNNEYILSLKNVEFVEE